MRRSSASAPTCSRCCAAVRGGEPVAVAAGSRWRARRCCALVDRRAGAAHPGIYFIMVTLAFAQMVYFVFHDTKIAGGADGIYVYVKPAASIAGWEPFDLENHVHFYFVVLLLLVLVYAAAALLLRSLVRPRARRHPRQRAAHALAGLPHLPLQARCFVLAGALAGLAGYLAAVQFGFVNPETARLARVRQRADDGDPRRHGHACRRGRRRLRLDAARTRLSGLAGGRRRGLGKHWQLLMGGFIVCAVLLLPHGLLGLTRLASQLRRKPAEAAE